MNIPIKSPSLFLVAVEDDWLAEAQSHCSFSVLPIALLLTGAVDEDLGALYHKALNKAFVLMPSSCT